MRLAAAGRSAGQLSALLLTHLHSDHLTDLNDVITTRWVTSTEENPLPIVGPPGTNAVVEATLAALHLDVGYRLAHHDDLPGPPSLRVIEVDEGVIEGPWSATLRAAPTDHRPVEPSIGFRIEADGASVVLAGDTVPCVGLDGLAAGADVLVHTALRHDLLAPVPVARLQEIMDYHSSVEQAAQTAQRAGVKILMLTHYLPTFPPGEGHDWRARAEQHFSGRVEVGDDLHSVSVPML